jgi:hypothetical protein
MAFFAFVEERGFWNLRNPQEKLVTMLKGGRAVLIYAARQRLAFSGTCELTPTPARTGSDCGARYWKRHIAREAARKGRDITGRS